jgi:hypothetical protein
MSFAPLSSGKQIAAGKRRRRVWRGQSSRHKADSARQLLFEALEPRILLSAESNLLASTALTSQPASNTSAVQTQTTSTPSPQVLTSSQTDASSLNSVVTPSSNSALLAQAPLTQTASLQITPTVTWTGAANGFWDVASNWSTGKVPGATDDVQLGGSVTVTVRSNQSIHSLLSSETLVLQSGILTLGGPSEIDGALQLTGGNVTANDALTITGATTWTSGEIRAATTGTVTNTGQMTLSGSGPFAAAGTFNNSGTVTLTGSGNFVVGSVFNGDVASTTTNLAGGLFDLQGTGGISTGASSGIQTHVFSNAGTVRKSVGTGVASIHPNNFINSGTLDVEAGTLNLSGPGNPTTNLVTGNNSTFTVASGAILDLTDNSQSNGVVTYKGTFTGSGQGTIRVASGTMVVDPAGATFNFAPGMFQWTNGDIRGSGTLTNAGSMTIAGTGTRLLAATLNNTGSITQTSANLQLDEDLIAGNQLFVGTLNNSGLYDIQADGITFSHGFSDAAAINNSGTFRKSAGTGTDTVSGIPFNNTGGTIDVETGTLALNGGTWAGGTVSTAAPGGTQSILQLASTYTLTGQINGTGTGLVELNGGNLVAGATGVVFDFVPGELQLISGTINGGTGGFTNVGSITVPNTVVAFAGKIANAGTMLLNGASEVALTSTATITNLAGGLIDFEGDGAITDHVTGAGPSSFVNSGRILKAGDTGPATLAFSNSSSSFLNSGTIDVELGTLVFAGHLAGTTEGNFTVAAGASVNLTTRLGGQIFATVVKGILQGTGQGTITLASDEVSIDPAGATFNFAPGLFQWTGGQIDGGNNGFGAQGTLTNAGTITLSGSNPKYLGTTLINTGTIAQAAGDLRFGSFPVGSINNQFVGRLINNGLYDLQGDVNLTTRDVVTNTGTFRKSAGTGTSSVEPPAHGMSLPTLR